MPNYPSMTDAELLRAWQAGDQHAGELLFERYFVQVRRFFRNKVAEPADLVQHTFLAVRESIDGFRGEASVRTFVFAIANNVLRKHFRRGRGPQGQVDLGTVSVEDLGESPSQVVCNREEKRLLLRALRRLSVDQQVLLELHYWEQVKVAEIAEIMGAPVGTIKTRMRTARKRLEQLIGTLDAAPGDAQSTISRLDDWAAGVRNRLDDAEPS